VAQIDLEEPTRPQLAALFGCSSRWIGELRSKGDLPADGASLLENIEAWAQNKYGVDDDADPDALDKEQQQARLAKEQADAKAMDNAERRRELASLPDMVAAGAGVIVMIVAQLQQVGARVAHADTKLRGRIDAEINNVLTDLSMTRIEEARGGGFDDGEPEDEGGA
jgi:phage terminase Nu1 subunit (DNA packaging protein)